MVIVVPLPMPPLAGLTAIMDAVGTTPSRLTQAAASASSSAPDNASRNARRTSLLLRSYNPQPEQGSFAWPGTVPVCGTSADPAIGDKGVLVLIAQAEANVGLINLEARDAAVRNSEIVMIDQLQDWMGLPVQPPAADGRRARQVRRGGRRRSS